MKLTKLRVKLLVFCAVFPIGFLGIQTEVGGQVPRPGCYCIGGYRYVGGSGGGTYGHTNSSTYRWDPCYMQSCRSGGQQQQPNPSQTIPFSVTRGTLVTVATRGGTLNARSGPGTNYPVVASLSNGSTLRLSGSSQGSWVQLDDGNWVHRSYLSASQ